MMYIPRGRDIVLEKLISTANSSSFNSKKPEAWLKIFEETIFCLMPTEKPELRFEFFDLLDKIEKNAPKVEIQQQIALLKNQAKTVYKVLLGWKGRSYLPDVPFDEAFFNPKKAQSKQKAWIKARDAVQKTRIAPGISLVSIIFTKQGEMLVDSKDNPPNLMFPTTPYSSLANLDIEHRDLKWIFSLSGKSWTNAINKIRAAVTNSVNILLLLFF